MSAPKTRPAKRLMAASGKCAAEGMAYGQCVLKTYSLMAHNACEAEFTRFRACVTKHLGK